MKKWGIWWHMYTHQMTIKRWIIPGTSQWMGKWATYFQTNSSCPSVAICQVEVPIFILLWGVYQPSKNGSVVPMKGLLSNCVVNMGPPMVASGKPWSPNHPFTLPKIVSSICRRCFEMVLGENHESLLHALSVGERHPQIACILWVFLHLLDDLLIASAYLNKFSLIMCVYLNIYIYI